MGGDLWPLLIINDPAKEVAPVALSEFITEYATNFSGLFACAIVTTVLPMSALFLMQRFFSNTPVAAGDK